MCLELKTVWPNNYIQKVGANVWTVVVSIFYVEALIVALEMGNQRRPVDADDSAVRVADQYFHVRAAGLRIPISFVRPPVRWVPR